MRKRTYSIVSFLATLLFIGCGVNSYTPSEVLTTVLDEVKHKTIEIRSLGQGTTETEAIKNAERNAFEIIFFRGIPNTSVEKPLIGIDEVALTSAHKTYFDSFFDKQRYQSFMISSIVSTNYVNKEGTFIGTNDIKINLIALKKDLEEKSVIRKFGL